MSNDWEKNEKIKQIKETLNDIVEENRFELSMGTTKNKIEFTNSFIMEYMERVYSAVRTSIDTNKEIVIYSTGYNLDDYIDRNGQLSPNVYWEFHKDTFADEYSYQDFLTSKWPTISKNGLSSWDDIMILEGNRENCLLTILSKDYCDYEYTNAIKEASRNKDSDLEYLLVEGPYNSQIDDFNDIVVIPKQLNSISNADIVRAIRWFIRHRLKITDKYSIRYATESEKDSGRTAFNNKIKSALNDFNIDFNDNQSVKTIFENNNIEYYYGKYLAVDI